MKVINEKKIQYTNNYRDYFIKSSFNRSNKITKKLKNFIHKINFLFYCYFSKPRYISVGCEEISIFKKLYPKDSNKFISYKCENLNDNKLKENWIFFEEFIKRLKNNTNFVELITHRGISSELIFHKILLKITKRLDFFFTEYYNLKKTVENLKPSSVIFQTTSPFYSPNIVFRKICKDLKIPFVSWIHGGTGLTNSLNIYDVTDYRLSKNIISWGIYLKELFKDSTCILNQLNLQTDIEVFPVGSVRLDYVYKKHLIKKKNFKKNKASNNFCSRGSSKEKSIFFWR